MIIPNKHKVDWSLICQKNQAKINKDNICENIMLVDYGYKVSDNIILNNKVEYKYEPPYQGLFEIIHTFTNREITLQLVPTEVRYNIRPIQPYKSKINYYYVHP